MINPDAADGFAPAGDCIECGNPCAGVVLTTELGAVSTICRPCYRSVEDVPFGVSIRPRKEREERWFPGEGKKASMDP